MRKAPRKLWPRKLEVQKAKRAQLFATVRELKRIELLNGNLPAPAQQMLRSVIKDFPELQQLPLNDGFPEGPSCETFQLIRTASTARSKVSRGWRHSKQLSLAAGGTGWMIQLAAPVIGFGNPKTPSLCWTISREPHAVATIFRESGKALVTPTSQPPPNETQNRNLREEADRVLVLLRKLSDETIRIAIDGICNWLDNWGK